MERKKKNTLFAVLVVIIGCLFISTCNNPWIQGLTDHMYCAVCERANARCICSPDTPALCTGVHQHNPETGRCNVCGALTYSLRDPGPGGGLIFYRSESGFPIVGTGTTAYYLEAAPAPAGTDPLHSWSGIYMSTFPAGGGTLGTLEGIGTGKRNTELIIEALLVIDPSRTGSAAQFAAQAQGGKNDWFLPSIEELEKMYENLRVYGVGGFVADYYWSSSAWPSADEKYSYNFTSGARYRDYTSINPLRVRAIRAF